MSNKIALWWQQHDSKIIVISALILTAVVAFQTGRTYQKSQEMAKISINLSQDPAQNPAQEKLLALGKAVQREGMTTPTAGPKVQGITTETGSSDQQNCRFVASKSSNKYHLPSCRYASKIKPENKLCFSSEEEAQQKGYQKAQCCLKD